VETWPRRDSNLLESVEVLGSSLAWYGHEQIGIRRAVKPAGPDRPMFRANGFVIHLVFDGLAREIECSPLANVE
jgi:hypothetical protein